MKRLLTACAIMALVGTAAYPASASDYSAMIDQAFLDQAPPSDAIKIPADAIPEGLSIEAWSLKGHLYVVSANRLTGTSPMPDRVSKSAASNRIVSEFHSPVYFAEEHFILCPSIVVSGTQDGK